MRAATQRPEENALLADLRARRDRARAEYLSAARRSPAAPGRSR